MAVDEQQVRDRIGYAKRLHADAQGQYELVKLLLTNDYDIPAEIEDLGIDIFQPAKPKALVAKALSILASRAKETVEVLPLTGVGKEHEACTKLEKYAQGVMKRGAEGRRLDPYLAWVMWYLVRGKGVLEWRFFPQYVDGPRFPIRPIAPNANTISEVSGDQGIIYYAKSYKRMKLDLLTELERLHKGGKTAWQLPDLGSYDDTQFVNVEEYWDDEYKALLVEDQVVWVNEHKYGFCPIVVAYCEGLPFDDPRWWGEGVIAPIRQALQQQAILQSKLLSAVELYYWPLVLIQGADGLATMFQATPTAIQDIPPDGKVTVIQPTVNAPLLEELNAWLEADINLMTGLPPISFGKEPGGQASGYLVAQILGQILDRFQQKLDDLGTAKGEHVRQMLLLTKRVLSGEVTGSDPTEGEGFSVDAEPEMGQRRRALVKVTAEDVDEERRVHVQIRPTLPQEMMMKVQMAERLRRPGVDQRPLLSDQTLREEYLVVESPDVEEERITDQMMRQLPEVQEHERAEWLENFWKEQQEGRGLPKLNERQVRELIQYVMQIARGEVPGAGMLSGTPPAPGMPPGMPPQMAPGGPPGLPPELGGSVVPGQAPPRPEDVLMEQMGGMPPGPGGGL